MPSASNWRLRTERKTKAVMMAHALGNPFSDHTCILPQIQPLVDKDNCDALGCSYSMPRQLAESLGFKDNSPGLDEGADRVAMDWNLG